MTGLPPEGTLDDSPGIESILDECLEAIREHRATLAECLAKYPQQAEELEPLLKVALAIEQIGDIVPSEEFKQATRARLLLADQKPMDGKAGSQACDGPAGSVTYNGKTYDPLTQLPPGRLPRSRRSKMD